MCGTARLKGTDFYSIHLVLILGFMLSASSLTLLPNWPHSNISHLVLSERIREKTRVCWLQHKWIVVTLLVLMGSLQMSSAIEDRSFAENFSILLFLGSQLQDLVLRTLSSCPEVLGLKRDEDGPVQNGLCKFILSLQEPYKEETLARAYYGGPAYHTSGFEPMTMLAGLAFLAFLLQTLHALLYRNPATTSLTPVSISRSSDYNVAPNVTHTVMSALDKYETLNTEKRMIQEEPWPWSSLTTSLRKTISHYWQARNIRSCMRNIFCRLFHQYKQNRL